MHLSSLRQFSSKTPCIERVSTLTNFDFHGPASLLGILSQLADGVSQIGGEGTVDMRFQCGQVNFNHLKKFLMITLKIQTKWEKKFNIHLTLAAYKIINSNRVR